MAPTNKPQPLSQESVQRFREEIDAFIDARVSQIARGCPGVPAAVIRNTIVRGGCQCASYLQLIEKDKAA